MPNDTSTKQTKMHLVDDNHPSIYRSNGAEQAQGANANCADFGPKISYAMTHGMPGCDDELGRLNLVCATLKLCPPRALNGDYLDFTNLVLTIEVDGGTKYTLPVRINGDLPVNFTNTTWQVSSGDQTISILLDNPSVINSEWINVLLRNGFIIKNGDFRGAQIISPTVVPDTEGAWIFDGTKVDGVQAASPSLTAGLTPQLPSSIVFANTTGSVTFSGRFEQVYVMLAGTTGDIQVRGATMGQWYNGRSIYITNIFNPNNGQCTQSNVPTFAVKASTLSGLDTWPTDIYSTCHVPPAIGSVQLVNSELACLHVASSTPSMTMVVDGSELRCTDPTLSTPFCPRGWFAMPPQTKAVIHASHMQDCHWAPSPAGSMIYSVQVTHSNVSQTGSGQPVFSNIQGAPIVLTNVTAYTTYSVNEASPLVLLSSIITPQLTMGGMRLTNVNFDDVNVTGMTQISGPITGRDVAFEDVSFVCQKGGVLPLGFNITNAHVYCSPHVAQGLTTEGPKIVETEATSPESTESLPVTVSSPSTWISEYAEAAITPALLGGIGGVTSALDNIAQEHGVGATERQSAIGLVTFVCYVLVSMRTAEDTAAALQQAILLMLMSMLFQVVNRLATQAATTLAEGGYTKTASACAFIGKHASKGVTLYGATSPARAVVQLAVGAVTSEVMRDVTQGIYNFTQSIAPRALPEPPTSIDTKGFPSP